MLPPSALPKVKTPRFASLHHFCQCSSIWTIGNGTNALVFFFLKLLKPEEGRTGGVADLHADKGKAVGYRHPIADGQIGAHLQHIIRAD